jgi:hypothetical protein
MRDKRDKRGVAPLAIFCSLLSLMPHRFELVQEPKFLGPAQFCSRERGEIGHGKFIIRRPKIKLHRKFAAFLLGMRRGVNCERQGCLSVTGVAKSIPPLKIGRIGSCYCNRGLKWVVFLGSNPPYPTHCPPRHTYMKTFVN